MQTFREILGTVLPDCFAVFLVILQGRIGSTIRRIISESIPGSDDTERWDAADNIARDVEVELFNHTFPVPGLVSLIACVGQALATGPLELLYGCVVAVILIAIDWMKVRPLLSSEPGRAMRQHTAVVILLALVCAGAKVWAAF